jgi:hypothetical protein
MSVDTIAFYQRLYRLLEDSSPLRFDCGRLCGAACCRVSPELPGMYLFPGEEALLRDAHGFSFSDVELPGWGNARLLSCVGTCVRGLRPLSCRIFPLAPVVDGQAAHARIDPRGSSVCPLCHQPASALSGGFVQAVELVFTALLEEPETAGFLRAVASEAEAFGKMSL